MQLGRRDGSVPPTIEKDNLHKLTYENHISKELPPPPFNFLGSVIKNSKNYQNELPPPPHLPHGYDFVDWFLNRNTCTYRENMNTLKDKNFSLLK